VAKLEIPDSALNAIAGEEMAKLRKEVARLEKKIVRLTNQVDSSKAMAAMAKRLNERVLGLAQELKEEFGLYDWD